MMKGLYIAAVDETSKEYGGVQKKINSQIKAFKNLDVEMDYIGISGENIKFINEIKRVYLKHKKQFLFFRYIFFNIDNIVDKYDFIYIRFSFCNYYMFKLAQKLKRKNKKVFIEIPTYPYYDEIDSNFKNNIIKKVDKLLWSINKDAIDRVVLTTKLDSVFGIKAINIFNGININDIKPINEEKKNAKEIKLIGVANISKWHGYDRVIRGLAKYYSNDFDKIVKFYIVGEGVEKINLELLVKELDLEKYVEIVGAKFGEELDLLYKNMDIGVSSLALFRAGGGHDPIKTKEYLGATRC